MVPELKRRLVTAAVVLPPVVVLVWIGGWPAAALFSVGSALATWEFVRLAVGQPRLHNAVTLFVAAALPWLPWWAAPSASLVALMGVALCSFSAWVVQVVRQNVEGAATEAPAAVQALVFCGLGPFFLSMLRFGPDGRTWAFAVIVVTIANDTAAYTGGKLFGRHRMAPRVSPGKTWEGFAAGALGAGVAAGGMTLWSSQVLSARDAVVIALVCSVIGPFGDLSKSVLKRSRGVKDSGGLLPGHGGLLDRIDALIANAPVIWAWAQWGR